MTDLAAVLNHELDLGLDGEGRWHRSSVARGIVLRDGTPIESPPVDRAQGIIYGYSVISEGPALGHDSAIDQTTMEQVVALGNQATHGIKSRFDHPNASNTSMGTFLGRTKNFRKSGDRVLGDLHLSESAKEAPQGDLYTYVLGLAERDPNAFGASIVFEGKFESQLNEDGTEKKDAQGKLLPRLTRVDSLLASDVVDDPAANPGGLFDKGDRLASKITAFLNRWAQHDLLPQLQAFLALHKEDDTMAEATATVPVTSHEQLAEARAAGVQAERDRVAAIHKSFAAVWGEQPPAGELKIRDGLVDLGIKVDEAETEFKKRKLTQITEAAPKTAGGGAETITTQVIDLSKLPLEDRCKVEWDSTPALREEFGQLSVYQSFKKAEATGQVKILKK
jgi:hypothetical protein